MSKVQWDAIGEVGFWAAERAAKSVAGSFGQVEEDDAFQEALIYIATHADEMNKQYEYGYSLPGARGEDAGGRKAVAMQLISRLREWARAEIRRTELELEAAAKVEVRKDLNRWANRPTPPGFEGLAYTPALIESLLPVLWDESLVAGIQGESGPAPDMPKAKTNPAHSGTHMAHVVDIRNAWSRTLLAEQHRIVLFLTYGCGWTQTEIAEDIGASQSTVSRYINGAIALIAHELNGKAVPLGDAE